MMPSFEDNLFAHRHAICSHETRDSTLSYAVNPVSLSHLGLIRYRVVTAKQTDGQSDRRTDRITIANAHLALHAVARKKQLSVFQSVILSAGSITFPLMLVKL